MNSSPAETSGGKNPGLRRQNFLCLCWLDLDIAFFVLGEAGGVEESCPPSNVNDGSEACRDKETRRRLASKSMLSGNRVGHCPEKCLVPRPKHHRCGWPADPLP